MPNFIEYGRAKSPGRRDASPTVTIQRRGLVSFSPAAMQALGQPKAVIFLVDKEEHLLGFRAAKAADARRGRSGNAYAVRPPGSLVSATAVLRSLGADLSESRRYPLVELDGVQCIDLKQPGTVVTSNRASR